MKYSRSVQTTGQIALPPWRARLLFGFLLLGFAGLIIRAVYLQGINNDFLQQKGDARYVRVIDVPAHRGMISDRNGEPLAISTPSESVWASPPDVEAKVEQVQQLAKILGLPFGELNGRIRDTSRGFIYLKRQIPPELAQQVLKLGIPGVSVKREYRRYYPGGETTSHLLGFTNVDDNGQEGIELSLQKQLGGKLGSQQVIKDRRGNIIEDMASLRAPKPGTNINLSIDTKMQFLAYREVKRAVEEHHAKAGSIIVIDAKSGEVLALANWPTYNPNNRLKPSLDVMRNRAVTDLFEPGSTMKPFTIATGLEDNKIRPETRINTENGVYNFAGHKIHDTHPEPSLTVSEVIQFSSNVGAAKIALSLSPETFWTSLSAAGFGRTTGCGFPGEASGRLRDYKKWMPIEQATMAFGNGISVNLLQLARAYTIFANDGELKPITMMRQDAPVAGVRVFSEKTSREVRDMMETVVAGGTAPQAQIKGYRVAGKTGTAHKLQNGHYVNRYVGSFVGMAPASNPRLIVAVMIDEPGGAVHYGGQVAAPAFSNVMGAALRELNVPYDAPLNNVMQPSNLDVVREEA
jgi:cell division protein FtsI (penicillin-binding protein 3)